MLVPKSVMQVGRVAAKEPTRYALNNVLLERRGGDCFAVATDGHRMIVASWDEASRTKAVASGSACAGPTASDEAKDAIHAGLLGGKDWSRLVPVPLALAAGKGGGRSGKLVRADEVKGDEPTTLTSIGPSGEVASVSSQPVDGRFIGSWNELVATNARRCDAAYVHVNAKLLAETLLAMIAATGENTVELRLPPRPDQTMAMRSHRSGRGAFPDEGFADECVALLHPLSGARKIADGRFGFDAPTPAAEVEPVPVETVPPIVEPPVHPVRLALPAPAPDELPPSAPVEPTPHPAERPKAVSKAPKPSRTARWGIAELREEAKRRGVQVAQPTWATLISVLFGRVDPACPIRLHPQMKLADYRAFAAFHGESACEGLGYDGVTERLVVAGRSATTAAVA